MHSTSLQPYRTTICYSTHSVQFRKVSLAKWRYNWITGHKIFIHSINGSDKYILRSNLGSFYAIPLLVIRNRSIVLLKIIFIVHVSFQIFTNCIENTTMAFVNFYQNRYATVDFVDISSYLCLYLSTAIHPYNCAQAKWKTKNKQKQAKKCLIYEKMDIIMYN